MSSVFVNNSFRKDYTVQLLKLFYYKHFLISHSFSKILCFKRQFFYELKSRVLGVARKEKITNISPRKLYQMSMMAVCLVIILLASAGTIDWFLTFKKYYVRYHAELQSYMLVAMVLIVQDQARHQKNIAR
jgi:hypothetical protein